MRRRRSSHHEAENHERWLVSYADLLTLLFAFFVVMFAARQADQAKAATVSAAMREALAKGGFTATIHAVLGGAPGMNSPGNGDRKGPGGASKPTAAEGDEGGVVELLPSLEKLNQQLAAEIASGKIQLDLQARGLVVSLREAAFFPSGSDQVLNASLATLGRLAAVVQTLPNPVRLEGHTDPIPIHTPRFASNWELSAARSVAMLNIMRDRFGIEERRMAVAGYADTVPVASNDTEEGRARNRRVDVVILNLRGLRSEPSASGRKH